MKRGPLGAGTLLTVSLATVLLIFAPPVSAEEEGPINLPDRFMVRGGYLYVFGADTNIAVNGPSGFGTAINYERTLDGKTDYSGFRIDAAYRFNERHSLGVSYYRVLRSSNSSTTEDLTVDDVTIAAGASVQSSLNFDMWRLTYNYSFYRNEKVELGLSPGLYLARIKFDIAGSATCSGSLPNCAGQPTVFGSTSDQLTVPLPSIGMYVNYNIIPRLMAQVRSDWFYLQAGDNFTGSMFEFYAGLEYRLLEHLALGVSYDRLQVNVDWSKSTSPSGVSVDNSWNTAFLYGALYF